MGNSDWWPGWLISLSVEGICSLFVLCILYSYWFDFNLLSKLAKYTFVISFIHCDKFWCWTSSKVLIVVSKEKDVTNYSFLAVHRLTSLLDSASGGWYADVPVTIFLGNQQEWFCFSLPWVSSLVRFLLLWSVYDRKWMFWEEGNLVFFFYIKNLKKKFDNRPSTPPPPPNKPSTPYLMVMTRVHAPAT